MIISNFQQGLSPSPYVAGGAFAKSVNLDVFSQEGIARINYLPSAVTGTMADLPLFASKLSTDASNFLVADDSNNAYLVNVSAGTFSGQGSATCGKYVLSWKGYTIGIAAAKPQYLSGTTWTDFHNSPTFSASSAYHYPFISRNDGKIYICSGRYIDVLSETAGQNFNPASDSTFGLSAGAFKLPEEYIAVGLAELGSYLVISAISVVYVTGSPQQSSNPVTTYFLWDRANTTADNIFEIPEKGLTNLINVGNTIFCSGGEKGKIYQLSESGYQLYAQIPFDYDSGKTIQIGQTGFPSMAWWRDMLLVGVSSSDYATGVEGLNPAGIYGIKNGRIAHQFLPNEGYDGSTKKIKIGFIFVLDETTFYFGWENTTDSTYGIDKVVTSGYRVPSYASYLESGFYQIGTKDAKKSFDKVEVQLARPLQTGEGVRIKYRGNINDSWTTLGTQTYTSNGAVSSLTFSGIHNLENIQIRCDLTTGASSSNTPYVLYVNLI